MAEETVAHLLTECSVAIGDTDGTDSPRTVEEYLHGDALMLRLAVGIVGRAIRVSVTQPSNENVTYLVLSHI